MKREYRVTRSIAAPAQRIWDLLTDAPGYKGWNPSVASIAGPIKAGRTIRLVSVVSPDRTFRLQVTSMSPPHRMTWAGGMPLGLFRGTRSFLIEPAAGGCQFSMSEEYTGLLAGPIFRSIPDLTDSFRQFAEGLKVAAERQVA